MAIRAGAYDSGSRGHARGTTPTVPLAASAIWRTSGREMLAVSVSSGCSNRHLPSGDAHEREFAEHLGARLQLYACYSCYSADHRSGVYAFALVAGAQRPVVAVLRRDCRDQD